MDIDIRNCFGVYDDARAAAERQGRARDLVAWRAGADARGFVERSLTQDQPSRDAALRYLARAPFKPRRRADGGRAR